MASEMAIHSPSGQRLLPIGMAGRMVVGTGHSFCGSSGKGKAWGRASAEDKSMLGGSMLGDEHKLHSGSSSGSLLDKGNMLSVWEQDDLISTCPKFPFLAESLSYVTL